MYIACAHLAIGLGLCLCLKCSIDNSCFLAMMKDGSQIAPIYLASCIKQGMGLLEILLSKQPVQNNQVPLKIIEICRLYELDSVSSDIMKVSITMNSASKEKTQAHIRELEEEVKLLKNHSHPNIVVSMVL